MPDVLDAVSAGEVDAGFVPIENSIEGMVNFTLDALAFDHELLIVREVVLDIHLCLAARPGIRLEDVKEILSIPVATAQCHRYLREFLPFADVRSALSTAGAAQLVSEDPAPHLAAIAPAIAAERYGLDVIAENIEDHDGNQTRFVLVRRARHPGADRPRPHGVGGVPARRRAGQPDLDPAGVRRPPAQPVEPDLAARPRTADSATTASSSSPTATSPTTSWPTRCAPCTPSRRRCKFFGSWPRADATDARRPRPRRRALAAADDWIAGAFATVDRRLSSVRTRSVRAMSTLGTGPIDSGGGHGLNVGPPGPHGAGHGRCSMAAIQRDTKSVCSHDPASVKWLPSHVQ